MHNNDIDATRSSRLFTPHNRRARFAERYASTLSPDAAALVKSPTPYATSARLIGKTPVWIFHGEADEKVSAKDAREMAAAIKAAGGSARYTEYAGQGHGIVDQAYAEEGLLEWLFAQRLTE